MYTVAPVILTRGVSMCEAKKIIKKKGIFKSNNNHNIVAKIAGKTLCFREAMESTFKIVSIQCREEN